MTGATDDTQTLGTEFQCCITSQFINSAGVAMGDPKLHYESDVVITPVEMAGRGRDTKAPAIMSAETASSDTDANAPKQREIPTFKLVENSKALTEQIYHPQRLFMDDIFKTIHDILSFDGETLITQISDRSRATFFTQDPCPALLTDVILLDAMFQTGGVFEFLTESALVLPYKIESLKFFDRGVKDADYLCITTRTASDEETDTFDIDLVDEKGELSDGIERLSDGEAAQIAGRVENRSITYIFSESNLSVNKNTNKKRVGFIHRDKIDPFFTRLKSP